MDGPIEARFENPELREQYRDSLGAAGEEHLRGIWTRSLEIGARHFGSPDTSQSNDTSANGFHAEDFASFTDLAAFGLRREIFLQLKNILFVPLRGPALNAGARFDPAHGHIVLFWSGLYHAIALSADDQAVEMHSDADLTNRPIYPLYRSSHLLVLSGIYFFGWPYLARREPKTLSALPDHIADEAYLMKRAAVNFVIAHELGHVFLGHTGDDGDPAVHEALIARQRELDADAWAIDALDVIRCANDWQRFVLAIQAVFDALLQVELLDNQYSNGPPLTHPLSTVRMEAAMSRILARPDIPQTDRSWIADYASKIRDRHATVDYVAAGLTLSEQARVLVDDFGPYMSLQRAWSATTDLESMGNSHRTTLAEHKMPRLIYGLALFMYLKRQLGLLNYHNGTDLYRERYRLRDEIGDTVASFEIVTSSWEIPPTASSLRDELEKCGMFNMKTLSAVMERASTFGGLSVDSDLIEEYLKMAASTKHPFRLDS